MPDAITGSETNKEAKEKRADQRGTDKQWKSPPRRGGAGPFFHLEITQLARDLVVLLCIKDGLHKVDKRFVSGLALLHSIPFPHFHGVPIFVLKRTIAVAEPLAVSMSFQCALSVQKEFFRMQSVKPVEIQFELWR